MREQFPDKNITLLFGCGGNRDQNKRSKMGKIADDHSDKIYLTDDNPRYENPNKIRKSPFVYLWKSIPNPTFKIVSFFFNIFFALKKSCKVVILKFCTQSNLIVFINGFKAIRIKNLCLK